MYLGFKIAVVYSDPSFRDKWFNDFFKYTDKSLINIVKKSNDTIQEVVMKDGTRIVAFDLNGHKKLRAVDPVYISKDDYEIKEFETIVKAAMTSNIFIELH